MKAATFACIVALAAIGAAAAVAGHIPSRELPRSLELMGYTGRLGEWELTANLARADNEKDELSGPMILRHVGICTVDGPEEKTGHMRVRLSSWSSDVEARLTIDGAECVYHGRLSDTQESELDCPDRRPTPITLWAKE